MARKKGEVVTLYCEGCTWSSELPMAATEQSVTIPCAHCGKPLHWHRCAQCGLGYVGAAEPSCPICSDSTLDEVSFD